MPRPARRGPTPLIAALLLGGLPPVAAGAQEAEPARIAAEVRAADSLFALDAAARGLDGWMHWMADDVVRPEFHGPTSQGKAAVRARDSVTVFGNPDHRLAWRPTGSGAFADARHGWTRGTWQLRDRAGAVLATGEYLTLWRREPDGWRVILDTGVADPPAQGTPD